MLWAAIALALRTEGTEPVLYHQVRLGRGRGLTLSITPEWGRTGSASEQLWSAHDARGLSPEGEFEAERRIVAEAGYGFGLTGNRGVLTPTRG